MVIYINYFLEDKSSFLIDQVDKIKKLKISMKIFQKRSRYMFLSMVKEGFPNILALNLITQESIKVIKYYYMLIYFS